MDTKWLQGRLIVLDGPDGCGKSTQVKMLCAWIARQGVEVRTFRDPGDTRIGEQVREILLSPAHEAMGTMTEFLLYMASRAQLWSEKIAPALAQGCCVVLDRWLSSTCAYQGHAGGFGVDRVLRVAQDTLERVWPDVTIILDVDTDTAAQRMDRELDRMELKGQAYHQKVRQGFLNLAQTQDRFVVVDATQPIDGVHKAVIQGVTGFY
ncbi:MAG: dTMP kinase [Phycisphaerae bacterium]|nr:dTMP kinase [Phycisphaerae bacterium]